MGSERQHRLTSLDFVMTPLLVTSYNVMYKNNSLVGETACEDLHSNGMENTLHGVLNFIPFVGPCYDLHSAFVYLREGNEDMARERAKNAGIGFATDAIVTTVVLATGAGFLGRNMILATLTAAFGTRIALHTLNTPRSGEYYAEE